jgi:hypothetical protein
MKYTPELYNYNVLGKPKLLDYTKCKVQATWMAADARNPAEIRKPPLLRIGLEFKVGLKMQRDIKIYGRWRLDRQANAYAGSHEQSFDAGLCRPTSLAALKVTHRSPTNLYHRYLSNTEDS